MNFIQEHPYLCLSLLAYLGFLGWLAWRYLKPPKDPPPSGMADSSFALTNLSFTGGEA